MANPLVETVRDCFMPAFHQIEANLSEQYPDLIFKLHEHRTGSREKYVKNGYDTRPYHLGISCVFSDDAEDVVLEVVTTSMASPSRIMADISWSEGRIETEWREWDTWQDWPEATEACIAELKDDFPKLIDAFKIVIERGHRLPYDLISA